MRWSHLLIQQTKQELYIWDDPWISALHSIRAAPRERSMTECVFHQGKISELVSSLDNWFDFHRSIFLRRHSSVSFLAHPVWGTQSDSVWLSTYISQHLLKMSGTTAHAHDLLAKSWLVCHCPECSCCAEIKIMNPSELNSDQLWHSSVYPESSRSLRVLHKVSANSAKQLKNCGGRVMSWIKLCSFFGAAIRLRENKEIWLQNISPLKNPLEASLFYAFVARGGGEAVEGALQTHKPQT